MIIVGIDVSKQKLDCLWLKDTSPMKVKTKVFKNTTTGFDELIVWVQKQAKCLIKEVRFVMEATGVYHESLAHRLYESGAEVVIANPAKVKAHAQSLGSRNKTDRKDSFVIAHYGATMEYRLWQPAPLEIRELKALQVRLQAVEADLQREKNRKEKSEIGHVSPAVIQSIDDTIKHLSLQRRLLQSQIDDHIDQHPDLKRDDGLLQTIPGVGTTVSLMMLLLLHGHEFKKASECAAFVGLNPIIEESGSSIRKPARLSKMGHAQVRAKLYMAAVVATRYNPDVRALYQSLIARGKSKMAALGAAMRKLVHICFGVIKHQVKYQPQVAITAN